MQMNYNGIYLYDKRISLCPLMPSFKLESI